MSFVSQTSEVNWVAMDGGRKELMDEILASGLYGSGLLTISHEIRIPEP